MVHTWLHDIHSFIIPYRWPRQPCDLAQQPSQQVAYFRKHSEIFSFPRSRLNSPLGNIRNVRAARFSMMDPDGLEVIIIKGRETTGAILSTNVKDLPFRLITRLAIPLPASANFERENYDTVAGTRYDSQAKWYAHVIYCDTSRRNVARN